MSAAQNPSWNAQPNQWNQNQAGINDGRNAGKDIGAGRQNNAYDNVALNMPNAQGQGAFPMYDLVLYAQQRRERMGCAHLSESALKLLHTLCALLIVGASIVSVVLAFNGVFYHNQTLIRVIRAFYIISCVVLPVYFIRNMLNDYRLPNALDYLFIAWAAETFSWVAFACAIKVFADHDNNTFRYAFWGMLICQAIRTVAVLVAALAIHLSAKAYTPEYVRRHNMPAPAFGYAGDQMAVGAPGRPGGIAGLLQASMHRPGLAQARPGEPQFAGIIENANDAGFRDMNNNNLVAAMFLVPKDWVANVPADRWDIRQRAAGDVNAGVAQQRGVGA